MGKSLRFRAPVVVGAVACVLACGARLVAWLSEYPDRLAEIEAAATFIDNIGPYAQEEDWSPSGKQALLYQITPIRADYFEERLAVLRHTFGQTELAVLDAGCGAGLISLALARRGGNNVTGVDAASGAVLAAQRTAEVQGLTGLARFQQGSLYELPFADGSFDAIVCSDVLEHLTDLRRALRELRRVLRPGGLLLIDTINRTILAWLVIIFGAERIAGVIPPNGHDWRLFITPDELVMGLRASGFAVDSEFPGFRPSLPMVWDVILSYVLRLFPREAVRSDPVLEGSPGLASYFATATAIETSGTEAES